MDMLCCLTVIMDMSAAPMGTAGLPSGSIPPLSPEAAARVKTTSTAQGEDFTFILHTAKIHSCDVNYILH